MILTAEEKERIDRVVSSTGGRRVVETRERLYLAGKADGVLDEREAVVQWLRKAEKDLDHPLDIPVGRMVDEIEAGEHRKED